MHRRSIPSPAPSFFPTTTTLKAYGLLDSSITPFLSIISICSSIHLCSFGVWYHMFNTSAVSNIVCPFRHNIIIFMKDLLYLFWVCVCYFVQEVISFFLEV